MERTVLDNREANVQENKTVKEALAVEIARINTETREREGNYKEGLNHITRLVDDHMKSDEQKYDKIQNTLIQITNQQAVALDRIALIVDGKLGGNNKSH